ncbi:MAG: hypothetical protein MZV49_08630 [Rhodopseudomonas palustris]|nr:hypothetical protein [Rhodopseudomonas palustris]
MSAPALTSSPVGAPRATATPVDRAALAAIAAAVSTEKMPQAPAPQPAAYGDITVRPIAQKPSLFPEPEAPQVVADEPPPEAFIPQQPDRRSEFARRGCRISTSCRFRHRTRSGRRRAMPTPTTRTRPACRCCSALPGVGLGRRDEETEIAGSDPSGRADDAANAAAAGSQDVRQRAGV